MKLTKTIKFQKPAAHLRSTPKALRRQIFIKFGNNHIVKNFCVRIQRASLIINGSSFLPPFQNRGIAPCPVLGKELPVTHSISPAPKNFQSRI